MKLKTQHPNIRFVPAHLLSTASADYGAGKKGEKNFKRGMQYEAAQQWEKAAQEFTLAVAAEPVGCGVSASFPPREL